MKKLYDEIMALDSDKYHEKDMPGDYARIYSLGYKHAKTRAAELAKKYDGEIDSLNDSISKLQSTSKILLELSRTRYNECLSAGQESIRRTLDEVAVLKESYLDENEKLSTLLLNSEDEISRLKGTILNLECRIEFLEK